MKLLRIPRRSKCEFHRFWGTFQSQTFQLIFHNADISRWDGNRWWSNERDGHSQVRHWLILFSFSVPSRKSHDSSTPWLDASRVKMWSDNTAFDSIASEAKKENLESYQRWRTHRAIGLMMWGIIKISRLIKSKPELRRCGNSINSFETFSIEVWVVTITPMTHGNFITEGEHEVISISFWNEHKSQETFEALWKYEIALLGGLWYNIVFCIRQTRGGLAWIGVIPDLFVEEDHKKFRQQNFMI